MTKRRIAILVGIFACLGTALFLARGQATPPPDTDLKSAALPGWPADQTWSWSFQLPTDMHTDDALSMRLRSKSSPIPPGTNPAISFSSSLMPASDAEHESFVGYLNVMSGPTPHATSGSVVIQLLDLSKIGAASTKPGQDLRVLGKLNLNGKYGVGGTELSGDKIFLPAGHFIGEAPQNEGHWHNHELYFMSFYIQQDAALVQYDVFLQCAPIPKSN